MKVAAAPRAPRLEGHRSGRAGWLRAAVLGSNDAIVSTASLMLGVAASAASREGVPIAGVAALVAGALSMAVGEYVSVSAQRDAEQADIARETTELAQNAQSELEELIAIYERRGLGHELAVQVAQALTRHDGLATHLREELGITDTSPPRPFQAAWVSASSFALFAAVPILGLLAVPADLRLVAIATLFLVSLAMLGALSGRLGGASMLRASARVTVGGALAMGATAIVGRVLGVAVTG